MSSNDQYQQINHFQELLNIDKKVDDMNVQLDVVMVELKKLITIANGLKKHSVDYKRLWSNQNTTKYQQVLEKCMNIEMSLENFNK